MGIPLKFGRVSSCLLSFGCSSSKRVTRIVNNSIQIILKTQHTLPPHRLLQVVAWPAKFRETKFRETVREIFSLRFAEFLNYFREILRNEIYENFAKFRESDLTSYMPVQEQILSPFTA
jgi:hypothetical protein